jgi:GAF domain-containing protein
MDTERLATTFVELADSLIDDYDVIELLQLLTERCVELLGVDAAGLVLADARGNLRVAAASSEQARLVELFELQNDEGPCLDCYREGRAVGAKLTGNGQVAWPRFTGEARSAGFEIVQAVPLRLRAQTIGALNLFWARPADVRPDDLRVAQALADVATIAILQERLTRNREVVAAQLQAALDSRIVIEQAKGVIAERRQVDVGEAFALLRQLARSSGRKLSEVAGDVVGGSLT